MKSCIHTHTHTHAYLACRRLSRMPNSTIPKISRRRSSSSHGGGDRTTTIVGLLFSTNLIHLLFFPCRTEIVASRREILSPLSSFSFRKQEETFLKEKERGFKPLDCSISSIFLFPFFRRRKRDRYTDDDVRHSDCATIFGCFTHLSSGREGRVERELERKGWDGWPARQLGVSGRCTPSLACQRGFDALRRPLTSFQRPDPAPLLRLLFRRHRPNPQTKSPG